MGKEGWGCALLVVGEVGGLRQVAGTGEGTKAVVREGRMDA